MTSVHTLLVGVAVLGSGCVTEETFVPRYTGTMRVTEQTRTPAGLASASMFGRITIPSQLEPTASIADCDYHGERVPAGITLGELHLAGLTEPTVIEPSSYIDGMLYHRNLPSEAVPEAATITAVLDPGGDAVTVAATAPAALTLVVLPAVLAFDAPTEITWEPGDGDEIEVRLTTSGTGNERALSCRTADIGRLTFPVEALAWFEGTDTEAALALTRRNVGHVASEPADLALTLAVEVTHVREVDLIR